MCYVCDPSMCRGVLSIYKLCVCVYEGCGDRFVVVLFGMCVDCCDYVNVI